MKKRQLTIEENQFLEDHYSNAPGFQREVVVECILNGAFAVKHIEGENGEIEVTVDANLSKCETTHQLRVIEEYILVTFLSRLYRHDISLDKDNFYRIAGNVFSTAERYHELREAGSESLIDKTDRRGIISDGDKMTDEKIQ